MNLNTSTRLKLVHLFQQYRRVAYTLSSGIKIEEGYTPISNNILNDYNKHRRFGPHRRFCYASFTNLFFKTNGCALTCCFNSQAVLGRYPEKTLHDIWFSEERRKISRHLINNDLSYGCYYCKYQLQTGRFFNLKPQTNDLYSTTNFNKYPRVIEFELSNQCNLECIMCSGRVSSSIRENREKQNPITNVYDDNYVNQLKEFIPFLKETKFYGGEPFLIDIYYKIWDCIIEKKPSISAYVLTNGTIFNDKVKRYIQKGNFDIGISLDALDKDTYESIRKNADFEKVMYNLNLFHKHCTERGKTLGLSITPTRTNWKEIPKIVEFANKLEASLYFSFVEKPEHLALWNFDKPCLEEIHKYWTNYNFKPITDRQKININCYTDLCNQIRNFIDNSSLSNYYSSSFVSDWENKQQINTISDIPWQDAYDEFEKKLHFFFEQKNNSNFYSHETKKTVLSLIKSVSDSILDADSKKKVFNKLRQLDINEMMIDEIAHSTTESLIEKAKYFFD